MSNVNGPLDDAVCEALGGTIGDDATAVSSEVSLGPDATAAHIGVAITKGPDGNEGVVGDGDGDGDGDASCVAASSSGTPCPPPSMSAAYLTDDCVLRTDPALCEGKLANGTSYAVKYNAKPKQRVELRLAVKVGSLHEDEHERGLAHFVEHLAFRAAGLVDFEVVKFFESIGAEFGPCQNAYTAFDETVYMLHVPIDRPGLLQKSLDVMREWAFGLDITDDNVERERQVIMEEWRSSRTGQGRMNNFMVEKLYEGCKYADRLCIGLTDVILHASPDTIRNFYKKWYRPDTVSIVAVGDFGMPVADVVEMVQRTFHTDPDHPPPSPPLSPYADMVCPSNAQPTFEIFTDNELTKSIVTVDTKFPARSLNTVAHFKRMLQENILMDILNQRLYKVCMSKKVSLYSASCSVQRPIKAFESVSIVGNVHAGGEVAGVGHLMREIRRLLVHGILQRELDVATMKMAKEYSMCLLEKEKTESTSFAKELVSNFIHGDPFMCISDEAALAQTVLQSMTVEQVKRCSLELLGTASNMVVVLAKPQPQVPSMRRGLTALARMWPWGTTREVQEAHVNNGIKAEIKKAFEEVAALDHECLEQVADVRATQWAAPEPAPATNSDGTPSNATVTDVFVESLHAHEWKLANGMRVVVKETEFQDDEVLFTGFAFGGWSEFEPSEHKTAQLATGFIREYGQYGIPPEEFGDQFPGTRVELDVNILEYKRWFSGAASSSDFQLLLQLIHALFITEFQRDAAREATLLKMWRDYITNEDRSPAARFANLLEEIKAGGHPAYRQMTIKDLDAINIDRAIQIYRECFGSPEDFTLTFIGKIDVVEARGLVEKYLGTIPTRPDIVGTVQGHPLGGTVRHFAIDFPQGVVRKDVRLPMKEPLCYVRMFAEVNADCTHLQKTPLGRSFMLGLLATYMNNRLLERLRFENSGVYGVCVTPDFTYTPYHVDDKRLWLLEVQFSCLPEKSESLVRMTAQAMGEMTRDLPTPHEVTTLLETERKKITDTNEHWRERIVSAYGSMRFQGSNAHQVHAEWEHTRAEILDTLTREVVRESCASFLPGMEGDVWAGLVATLKPAETLVSRYLPAAVSHSGASLAVLSMSVALGALLLRKRL